MFDELFTDVNYEFGENDLNSVKEIINKYKEMFDINDDKETWFNKIKDLSEELGYASDMKAYRENPDNYKGSVADVSNIIRVSLTTKTTTPDLYEIMKLLGKERILKRFENIANM